MDSPWIPPTPIESSTHGSPAFSTIMKPWKRRACFHGERSPTVTEISRLLLVVWTMTSHSFPFSLSFPWLCLFRKLLCSRWRFGWQEEIDWYRGPHRTRYTPWTRRPYSSRFPTTSTLTAGRQPQEGIFQTCNHWMCCIRCQFLFLSAQYNLNKHILNPTTYSFLPCISFQTMQSSS